jgi:hypothetical protein
MGTRGLTVVIYGGETKIAQYGQWDHYPSGQGITCLEFLQKAIHEKFKEKLGLCRFLTVEEQDKIDCHLGTWTTDYPFLTRDHGSNVLNVINESNVDEVLLIDNTGFGTNGEGFMCEYVYVIDYDRNVFEVYGGLYIPENLAVSYDINNLPTEEEFLKELEEI